MNTQIWWIFFVFGNSDLLLYITWIFAYGLLSLSIIIFLISVFVVLPAKVQDFFLIRLCVCLCWVCLPFSGFLKFLFYLLYLIYGGGSGFQLVVPSSGGFGCMLVFLSGGGLPVNGYVARKRIRGNGYGETTFYKNIGNGNVGETRKY